MGKYIKPKGKDGQRSDTQELKRLREIIKSRDSQIFNLYIKIFPGDEWVDAEQALMRIYDEATSP